MDGLAVEALRAMADHFNATVEIEMESDGVSGSIRVLDCTEWTIVGRTFRTESDSSYGLRRAAISAISELVVKCLARMEDLE
jgi:hypothetical protein